MLEPVSLHQTRFNAPGIAPDPRGIALGQHGAALFHTIDSLVGWFRVLSDEIPLDDLLPSLTILEVRSSLQSLAFLVVFHAESSYLLDRASRLARLLGGVAFTGTGKHLVQYRDGDSPLGYDVDATSTESGDFVLYTASYTQAWRKVRDIPFAQLVFRLSPRRVPGKDAADRQVLWLTVVPGLARSVLAYLYRNRVRVAAAMVEREGVRSAFGEARGAFPSQYLLARVSEMPERMLDLFAEVPGIALYRPATESAIVEVGYRHPLHLPSCGPIFDKNRFYIFSGRRDSVDVIAAEGGGLALVDGERLVGVGFDLGAPVPRATPARTADISQIKISLRLVQSLAPPRRVTAALLGWEQAEQLKRLAFALPPTVLAGCRIAPILDGLLVIAGVAGTAGAPTGASLGIESLPIGEPFYEAAPSIYVPVGLEFLPRVSESILVEHVGGTDGRRIVFKRGAEKPIGVPESAFEPLSRRVLGRLDVEVRSRAPRETEPREIAPAEVVNDPAGLFPLWGYRVPRPPEEA